MSSGLKLVCSHRVSYKSLTYGFRVAPNTIASVVPEVYQAIYDHYHETFVKSYSSKTLGARTGYASYVVARGAGIAIIYS